MLKSARTGIAVALFLTSLAAAGTLLLNPRFFDDLSAGVLLFVLLPIVGGFGLGVVLGRPLQRLAEAGSNEDPIRALELLWASLMGFVVFLTALALLPPYLGIFSDSETVRYGGAMVLAVLLAALGTVTILEVARRGRPFVWPLLLALPVTAVVWGGTEWGRGKSPGSRILVVAVPGLAGSVAEDLIERGQMPTLAALRRSGTWGDIQGLRPPIPEVVWTSVATGKTSAEHGVLSFNATSA